ncbi:MAG: hypothetical protein RMK84_02650 [Oscillochloridaceae bacterium]|nr:hypothetical protein [Chloroflexaceae bacterium]MDW8389003.1 hypothetical protein [Oscillochloridaceae bacterium]
MRALIEAQRATPASLLARLQERTATLEPERSCDCLVLRYHIGRLEAALLWPDAWGSA